VLVKVHDGELIYAEVEELERAIATGDDELVLVDLGPGEVIEGIVGIEPGGAHASATGHVGGGMETWGGPLRLLDLDALRGQAKGEEASVADDAKVGRGGDGDARVVVGRVLDGVGIVALGAELEHRSHGGMRDGAGGLVGRARGDRTTVSQAL
jgi:hypothetical protein